MPVYAMMMLLRCRYHYDSHAMPLTRWRPCAMLLFLLSLLIYRLLPLFDIYYVSLRHFHAILFAMISPLMPII